MTNLGVFTKQLEKLKLAGFIVTSPVNIFYLTGFRGVSPTEREAILIFSPVKQATLTTARLYRGEAQKLASENLKVEIIDARSQIYKLSQQLLKNAKRVGFEEQDLKYSEFREFKKALGISIQLVPFKNLVEDLRIFKSGEEIRKIERAQIISQKAFEQLIKTIKIGQKELDIAENLAKIIKNLGGQGLAFETIAAAGPNAALPHYITGRQKLKKGQVLLLDFGAKYQNYCADITRTVFIGKVDDQKRNIYRLVAQAQRKAIEKIAPRIKTADVYHAANNLFKKENLHTFFIHGLGHGIGLEVHERPYLRPAPPKLSNTQKSLGDELLGENMTFSVEPGLYFPAWGGVRIEDLVTIKSGRAIVLGKLPEEIVVI